MISSRSDHGSFIQTIGPVVIVGPQHDKFLYHGSFIQTIGSVVIIGPQHDKFLYHGSFIQPVGPDPEPHPPSPQERIMISQKW